MNVRTPAGSDPDGGRHPDTKEEHGMQVKDSPGGTAAVLDDPVVADVFAALGALGLPALADAAVRDRIARAAVRAVRAADALDAIRVDLVRAGDA